MEKTTVKAISEFFVEKNEKKSRYDWLPLSKIDKWIPIMKKRKVSEVARSPRGFLTAYRRVKGKQSDLSANWWKKREAFIKRHKAQLSSDKEGLFVDRDIDGKKQSVPTDRHLALIAWAYSPSNSI